MKETKELLVFILVGVRNLVAAKESPDGVFNVGSLSTIAIPLLMQSGEAFGGIGDVLEEVKKSNMEQRAELVGMVKETIQDYTDEELDADLDDVEKILASFDSIASRRGLLPDTSVPK